MNYCHHCLPCSEGIEIESAIWDLDQIPARGIEQIKEWYSEFPVKPAACVECGVCVQRCPFDAHTECGAAKMREVAAVFEGQAAQEVTVERQLVGLTTRRAQAEGPGPAT